MGIVRPIMEVHPKAWVFFVIFILIATFTMLNLFIVIIVNAMQTFTEYEHQDADAARAASEIELHQQMSALRGEIAELKQLLSREAKENRR